MAIFSADAGLLGTSLRGCSSAGLRLFMTSSVKVVCSDLISLDKHPFLRYVR